MMRPRRWRRDDILALGFVLLVVLVFCWPLITPDRSNRYSFPSGDFYNQFYAFARYEHDRLWSGEIPLWNPYTFGGHPFLADVQAAVFYPPSLLTMLMSGPGTLSPQWLIVEAIAHLGLAAVFTYLFVRRLTGGLGRAASVSASVLSAVTFALGGYLTGYPPLQLAILETQVWLPLVLLLIDVGLSRRSWTYVVSAGAVWGMSLLAGHPQSAMYVFYCTAAYAFFCSWRRRLPWTWVIVAQLCWAGIGFGLAAVHLVPGWEFWRLSVRTELGYQELAGGLGWLDLVQYVLPGTVTTWSPVYVGILGLSLAVGACLSVCRTVKGLEDKRAETLFWAVLALMGLLLSLGDKGIVYRVFYRVAPGFRLFRSQERAIYVTGFSLAVLAGYGWSGLSAGWPRARMSRLVNGILWTLAALAGGTLVVIWIQAAGGQEVEPWREGLLCLFLLAVGGLIALRVFRENRRLGRLLFLGLVAVDLILVNAGTNLSPGPASERIYDDAWLQPVLDQPSRFRIVNDFGLPGNAGCWLQEEDMAGASPLRLQSHRIMMDALPRWRLWEMFDVAYVITWEHDLPGPFAARRVAMQGDEWAKDTVYVHHLEKDFARVWIVHQAQYKTGIAALEAMADPGFDPVSEVILTDSEWAFEAASTEIVSRAEVLDYAPEEIVVQTDLQAPGWLVLGEWYYPGWQVWIDGARDLVSRVDFGLRGVALPAGSHEVVFRYRPLSVLVGAGITVLTLGGVMWAMLYGRRRSAVRSHAVGNVDGAGGST
jgi:hypothetical protein